MGWCCRRLRVCIVFTQSQKLPAAVAVAPAGADVQVRVEVERHEHAVLRLAPVRLVRVALPRAPGPVGVLGNLVALSPLVPPCIHTLSGVSNLKLNIWRTFHGLIIQPSPVDICLGQVGTQIILLPVTLELDKVTSVLPTILKQIKRVRCLDNLYNGYILPPELQTSSKFLKRRNSKIHRLRMHHQDNHSPPYSGMHPGE